MRDLETTDSELRLLAAVRWSIREHGGEPSSRQVDELLDERLTHRGRRESGVLELVSTKRVVRYSCPPRCFLKLSVSESQLSRADYPGGRCHETAL
jgi:hypothetical protein